MNRILLATLLLTACSDPPAKPIAKAPPSPAPIAVQKIEPPPSAEADAVAKTLLGLDKPKPSIQAAVQQKPAQRKAPRRPELIMPDETDLTDYAGEPGLSEADFQNAIEAWGGFKNCLAMAAYRNGRQNENGAVKVEFEIQQTGTVVRSKVLESGSPELAECVESRSKNIRFPAFAGAESVTKAAKFVF